MPDRYDADHEPSGLHPENNRDPDAGGCPHCGKQSAGQGHSSGCPVRRERRHKRRGRITFLKNLFGGLL